MRAEVLLAPSAPSRRGATGAVTGRLFVVVARDASTEPHLQVGPIAASPALWGTDVEGWRPGDVVVVPLGPPARGFPLTDAAALAPGRYRAQAVLAVRTRFDREQGPPVWLHLPGGDGARTFTGTGTLVGPVVDLEVPEGGADGEAPLRLRLDRALEPVHPVPDGGTAMQGNPPDSPHVRHVKVRSGALSRFWGRDVHVAASVLLPRGYDDPASADVRYPLEVAHGHYAHHAPRAFTEDGDDDFSRYWLSGEAPGVITMTVRHENPYGDTSYGVDSENCGPWGTAINDELLPEVERRFRTTGQRWGRVLSGGSTGGWIAAATQLLRPELYRGAWVGYPDPLSFAAFGPVDLYRDASAHVTRHPFLDVEVPSAREVDGRTRYTIRQENAWEDALGPRCRSGYGVWDLWEAVWSPRAADGYPAPAWDKATGAVDRAVVEHWRTRWDLAEVMAARWDALRPLVGGQLDVWVSDTDNYFLDLGVAAFRARTEHLPGADVRYRTGRGQPHHWVPMSSREHYEAVADHVAGGAPARAGAEVARWRRPASSRTTSGHEPLVQV